MVWNHNGSKMNKMIFFALPIPINGLKKLLATTCLAEINMDLFCRGPQHIMAVQEQSLHHDSAALCHTLLLRNHRDGRHPQQQLGRSRCHQKQKGDFELRVMNYV
jgi:hypothetical protein